MDLLASRAPWYLAGPVIGLIVMLLLWVTNKPFGALGGYIELTEWAGGRRPGWRVYFTLGVVVGGLLSAVVGLGWTPTVAYGTFDHMFGSSLAVKAVVLFGAGALMGAGGRLAGGCTAGHGICGMALGSTASLVSTATFMAVAVGMAQLLAWLFGGGA
jgi:uncharacterized membrane protein YedE/YeeE